jgi:T5SS/PEP-CTERM-associated repeat protein
MKRCQSAVRLPIRGQKRATVAIPAVWFLIAAMAQIEARAAIIINSRDGRTHVEGQLLGNHSIGGDPPMFVQDITNGYNVVQLAPDGLGTFMLIGIPPEGKTTIPGASAVTNANVNATITLNTVADTLSVTSSGSVSEMVSGTFNSQRRDIAVADGSASFSLSFTTDREYDYTITSDLSAAAQQVTDFPHAQAVIDMGGPGWFFSQDRIINCDGCDSNDGSSTGTILPGNHSIQGTVSAFTNSLNGTSATANYTFSFSLTPAPPSRHWINPAGGFFGVDSHWDEPIVPGAQDAAIFDLPGTYTVQLDQDVTNKRLRTNGSGVNLTFDLNGSDYHASEIQVGGRTGDSVILSFTDSNPPVSVAAAFGPILPSHTPGHTPPPEARLFADLLKASEGGDARVDIPILTTTGKIEKGGFVRVLAKGAWTVPTLDVGQGGLVLQNGGTVVSSGLMTLAPDATDVTLASVAGTGSRMVVTNLAVGKKGNGTLGVTSRGGVFADQIVIGDDAGSQGNVELTNSATLVQESNDFLTVGLNGRGFLSLTDATVDAGTLFIGAIAGSDGEVKVGMSSTLRVLGAPTSPLFVGIGGVGKLIVENGGRVTRENFGATAVGTQGRIEIPHGHLHAGLKLTLHGRLTLDDALGSASIGQTSVAAPGFLIVGQGGTFAGTGHIAGHVFVNFGTNEFAGTVSPASSPGTLTIEGNYEQHGRLIIEMAGTAPGQFDVLAVMGNAMLGGELVLEFIDGFAPRQGDVFKFLDVGGALNGTFDSVKVRNLKAGFQFDVQNDGSGLAMIALNDGTFVPEPTTLAMFFAGMLVTMLCRRVR